MARPSVVPEILEKLEPYLEALEHAWMAQPEDRRVPTLPVTNDNKVNVRAVVLGAGLRQTLEQHFFTKPDVAGPVNALAKVQGVKPIGSRGLDDAEDEAVRRRVAKVGGDNTELRRTLAEREALVEVLRRENGRLRAQVGFLEETGMTLRGDVP